MKIGYKYFVKLKEDSYINISTFGNVYKGEFIARLAQLSGDNYVFTMETSGSSLFIPFKDVESFILIEED